MLHCKPFRVHMSASSAIGIRKTEKPVLLQTRTFCHNPANSNCSKYNTNYGNNNHNSKVDHYNKINDNNSEPTRRNQEGNENDGRSRHPSLFYRYQDSTSLAGYMKSMMNKGNYGKAEETFLHAVAMQQQQPQQQEEQQEKQQEEQQQSLPQQQQQQQQHQSSLLPQQQPQQLQQRPQPQDKLINERTCSIYLKCLVSQAKLGDALSFLRGMHTNLAIQPDAFHYNIVIGGLWRNKRGKEARELQEEMEKVGGISAGAVTHAIQLGGYLNGGKLALARDFYYRMQNAGTLTLGAYRSLILKFWEGHAPFAIRLFRDMFANGIKPDRDIYELMIDNSVKHGFVKFAKEVLMCMRDSVDVLPTQKEYVRVIALFWKHGEARAAEELFRDMLEVMAPTVVAFGAMIQGYTKNKQLDKALELKKAMMAAGAQPNVLIYNMLIGGAWNANEEAVAIQLFSEMSESGVTPDTVTFNIMMDAYTKRSQFAKVLETVDRMREANVPADLKTYSSLIDACWRAKEKESAMRFFQEMSDNHVTPDNSLYGMMIKRYLQSNEPERALQLWEQSHAQGITLDSGLYVQVATCAAKWVSQLCAEA